jgi:hypothetical protein
VCLTSFLFGSSDVKKNVQRTIDYSLDTNNFFDTVQKKTLLQLAADTLLSHFGDTLDAIMEYDLNTWSAIFTHPGENVQSEVPGLVVAENEIIIYADGRDIAPLGIGVLVVLHIHI